MLLFLMGCEEAPPVEDTGAGGEDSAPEDSGVEDSGDSGDTGPSEIPDGPDCSEQGLPMETAYNVVVGHVVEGTATDAELADLTRLVETWAPGVSGPWSHTVRGPFVVDHALEVSGGGEVMAQASVADVIRRADGTFVSLFVDGDTEAMLAQAHAREPFPMGLRGLGGLGAATSPDGHSWTPAALTTEATFPAYVVDPELQRLSDGRYALYFYGVPAAELCADSPDPFGVPGPHRLYRAESDDLLHWGSPLQVFLTQEGGTDPAIWCISDTRCYGWFQGGLRSDDGGASWAQATDLSLETPPQLPDVVAMTDGWRMFFQSGGFLESAWSDDGAVFRDEGALDVETGSPSVLMADGALWLYQSGVPQAP